ncbi:hypothetical protein ACJJTC_001155 [Scirpophaga incertulas]
MCAIQRKRIVFGFVTFPRRQSYVAGIKDDLDSKGGSVKLIAGLCGAPSERVHNPALIPTGNSVFGNEKFVQENEQTGTAEIDQSREEECAQSQSCSKRRHKVRKWGYWEAYRTSKRLNIDCRRDEATISKGGGGLPTRDNLCYWHRCWTPAIRADPRM